jgi:hypothetical protein
MSHYSDLVDLICLVPDHTLKSQPLEAAGEMKHAMIDEFEQAAEEAAKKLRPADLPSLCGQQIHLTADRRWRRLKLPWPWGKANSVLATIKVMADPDVPVEVTARGQRGLGGIQFIQRGFLMNCPIARGHWPLLVRSPQGKAEVSIQFMWEERCSAMSL